MMFILWMVLQDVIRDPNLEVTFIITMVEGGDLNNNNNNLYSKIDSDQNVLHVVLYTNPMIVLLGYQFVLNVTRLVTSQNSVIPLP